MQSVHLSISHTLSHSHRHLLSFALLEVGKAIDKHRRRTRHPRTKNTLIPTLSAWGVLDRVPQQIRHAVRRFCQHCWSEIGALVSESRRRQAKGCIFEVFLMLGYALFWEICWAESDKRSWSLLAIECVVFCSVVWTGKMEEGLARRGDPSGSWWRPSEEALLRERSTS